MENKVITVDVMNMACPMPILMTSIALKKAPSGTVFEVKANDSVFGRDIEAWCAKTRNKLVCLTRDGQNITAQIEKS